MRRLARTFSDICLEEGIYFCGVLVDSSGKAVSAKAGDDIDLVQHVSMISELSHATTELIDYVFLEGDAEYEGDDE